MSRRIPDKNEQRILRGLGLMMWGAVFVFFGAFFFWTTPPSLSSGEFWVSAVCSGMGGPMVVIGIALYRHAD